tara:strand:- start:109 stop:354 length:246 start_codon:yes stop_codon:yes gene_type:complete
MLAEKKTNKNSLLIKKKPINDKMTINIGIMTSPILFSLICAEFDLSSKKGKVEPKCVSAKSKMVITTSSVSRLGNRYKTKA